MLEWIYQINLLIHPLIASNKRTLECALFITAVRSTMV